jgi:DNA repair protein RadC
VTQPSQADRHITKQLQQALDLIGVRVIDHMIVGEDEVLSFAENGFL